MDDDLRWYRYLFSSHSEAELAEWVRSLEFFRFCRAFGGHANDGDRLLVAVRIESEGDLVAVLEQLGIGVQRLPESNPSGIHQFPGIQQPGTVRLAGADVFCWVNPGRLELWISDADDPYNVSAAAISSARLVEPCLSPLSGRLIDPPLDDRHCLCPKFYPAIWDSPP